MIYVQAPLLFSAFVNKAMVIHVHLPNCLDFDEKEKKENFLLHVINYPQDKKNVHLKNVEAYVM